MSVQSISCEPSGCSHLFIGLWKGAAAAGAAAAQPIEHGA